MRHALWRLYHAGALQVNVLVAEIVEQPLSLAEQHGDEVDLELVQEPCPDRLLRDVSADANPRIVPVFTACPDGAEMDCRIRRSTRAMPVTITPTASASFVATQ